jgi:hypothetical protein
MAQIKSVVSESLQATIRRLLPSQSGFTEDLQAQNVIVPVIDVTPSAEGSQLPSFLQTAASFAGSTGFAITNATTTLISNPGFYIIRGEINCDSSDFATLRIGNGSSRTGLISYQGANSGAGIIPFEFVVFLDTDDLVDAQSTGTGSQVAGLHFQIADRYGVLNNPSGFTFE